jgi:iron-sulfur cluster repair protein YtfE (RIC family)
MTAIPHSLKMEHHELHEELARATREPGAVGETARGVAKVLHPHFVKEEQFAMPPLGALAAVARGEKVADAATVIAQARRVADELPQMLAEHRQVVLALERLQEAAIEAGQPQYAQFAEKLKLHAQTEEEVLYPAAILIGRALERLRVEAAFS